MQIMDCRFESMKCNRAAGLRYISTWYCRLYTAAPGQDGTALAAWLFECVAGWKAARQEVGAFVAV